MLGWAAGAASFFMCHVPTFAEFSSQHGYSGTVMEHGATFKHTRCPWPGALN